MYTSRAEGGNTVYLSDHGLASDPRFSGQGLVDTVATSASSVRKACSASGVTHVEAVSTQEGMDFQPGFSNFTQMFNNCSGLTDISLAKLDTSQATAMSGMFQGCSALTSLDLLNFDTSKVGLMSDMFSGCSALTSLDLSYFKTSEVTNMSRMFSGCSSLVSLDLSNFDTSRLTNAVAMFYNCSALTSLDLSNFDTSKLTSLGSMFKGCSSLVSLDLSNFDTSKITDTNDMFSGCSALASVDLSNFDTSQVKSMTRMFDGCTALTSLDLSGFDASEVGSTFNLLNGYAGDVLILFKMYPTDTGWKEALSSYYKPDGTQVGETPITEPCLMLFKEPPSKQAVTWVQLLKTVSELRKKTGAARAEVNALKHRVAELESA